MVSLSHLAVWVGLAGALTGAPAAAATYDDQKRALDLITETAGKLCNVISASGEDQSFGVQGEVKAQLNGLARHLADLGISGAGNFDSNHYVGVLRQDLATALRDNAQCKLRVFEKLQDKLLPAIPQGSGRGDRGSAPGPIGATGRRVAEKTGGWNISFSARGAGGGNFDNFPSRSVTVDTPAAIDVRSLLPANLSSRNVYVSITASTDHTVSRSGRWVYFITITNYGGYTQCTRFDVATDGVPIGGGALAVMQGPATTDQSMPAQQDDGVHRLTVNLGCFILARQFPVLSFRLKAPDGEWHRPTAADFSVVPPFNPDRPPDAQSGR